MRRKPNRISYLITPIDFKNNREKVTEEKNFGDSPDQTFDYLTGLPGRLAAAVEKD